MANGIKYQAHELLNKVLNAGEDALNVDLSDSVTVTVDSEFPAAAALADNSGNPTTTSVGSHLLGYDSGNTNWNRVEVDDVGHLQVDVLTITAGDNNIGNVDIASIAAGDNNIGNVDIASSVALTVDLGSNNDIKIASGQVESGAFASGALASGSVADGAMVTLGAKADAKNAATDGTAITAMQVLKQISSSVQILEDWDDSDLANVNLNLSGSDADKGEGVLSSQTLRVSLATNDDGVTHLATIAADTTSVDGKITACNTGAVVLAAGSAAIGKLAANDGVDIGDVDVTSVVPGYGATNLGKREDDAHSNLDTGVMALAVRNDAIAAIGAADGDYAPLQVNSAGSLYTKDETGEAGSILVKGTNAVAAGISGTVFIAIQFLEDTVFHDDDGLVASSTQLYPDDAGVGSDISSNGGNTDDVVFPQGMTIFGRWAGFKLASGTVIAYVGYV